jgi:hypothetical protein
LSVDNYSLFTYTPIKSPRIDKFTKDELERWFEDQYEQRPVALTNDEPYATVQAIDAVCRLRDAQLAALGRLSEKQIQEIDQHNKYIRPLAKVAVTN